MSPALESQSPGEKPRIEIARTLAPHPRINPLRLVVLHGLVQPQRLIEKSIPLLLIHSRSGIQP
jgi:hypothetical protein